MPPTISILHATRIDDIRQRSEWFWRAYSWACDRAVDRTQLEFIIAMDEDDKALEAIQKLIAGGSLVKCPTSLVVGPKDQGNNGAWNLAATKAAGKVLVQLSDDFECPPDWDQRVVSYFNKAGGLDKPLVLGVGDPHFSGQYSGDGLLSIYIATKAYIDRTGYFLYPEYPSLFSDTELAQKACMEDALVDAYDTLYFYHHWHGGPEDPQRDDTYYKHATTWHNDTGRNVFADRMWSAFPDMIPGRFDETRDLTTREEGLCPPDAIYPNLTKLLLEKRAYRKANWVKNKPFETGDFRRAWIDGDWKTARDGATALMAKCHQKFCGGRFLAHGLHHIWYYCSQLLGDRTLVGVRETHI